jgi:hypothetical protein
MWPNSRAIRRPRGRHPSQTTVHRGEDSSNEQYDRSQQSNRCRRGELMSECPAGIHNRTAQSALTGGRRHDRRPNETCDVKTAAHRGGANRRAGKQAQRNIHALVCNRWPQLCLLRIRIRRPRPVAAVASPLLRGRLNRHRSVCLKAEHRTRGIADGMHHQPGRERANSYRPQRTGDRRLAECHGTRWQCLSKAIGKMPQLLQRPKTLITPDDSPPFGACQRRPALRGRESRADTLSWRL